MSTGAATLHFLRTPRERFADGPGLVQLLPFLKRITQGVLTRSHQVAEAIAQRRGHTSARRNVLNGVYIPALHQLLSYEEPKADATPEETRRREFAARYLLEAGSYSNAIRFGYPDGFRFHFAIRLPEHYGKHPDFISTPQCPPHRDGEELALWQLGFVYNGNEHALILKDAAHLKFDATEGSNTDAEALQQLRSSPGQIAAVLVANANSLTTPIRPEKMFDGLIIESDPIKAADAAFMALTASKVPSEAA